MKLQNGALKAKSSEGINRIARERMRQIEVEGWSDQHDDQHERGQLAYAAAVYAASDQELFVGHLLGPDRTHPKPILLEPIPIWPFDPKCDKRNKHSRIRQLEIAGALIAAEIDRLVRNGHKR